MYKTLADTRAFFLLIPAARYRREALRHRGRPPVHCNICRGRGAKGSSIAIAGQNVSWSKEGAFTGEVSAPMLAEAGCRYVIIGHSERRQLFRETDDNVAKKSFDGAGEAA